MPTGRKALSACTVDGKIYAVGGATTPGTTFRTVEVYDPATDTWMKEDDMSTARCLLSASAVNGSIYSVGGSSLYWPWTGIPAVEVYDTGFAPLPDEMPEARPVLPQGKLPTTWGKIKGN
jgi:hypothetical protein